MYEPSQSKLIAEFVCWGEPVSKARARFTKYGSKTLAYTPQKTLDAEKGVARAFKEAGGFYDPDPELAYKVTATFYNATRQRRDVDNMLKLILDGLNKTAWPDDTQVLDVVGRKRYVSSKDEARTEVAIYVIGTINKPKKKCAGCGKMVRTYDSTAEMTAHCSRECAVEHRRRNSMRVCEQCGIVFEARKSTSKARFCSRDCSCESRNVETCCAVCGIVFKRAQSLVKPVNYCTAKCRDKAAAPRRTANARGTCSDCGGPTSKKQYVRCMPCRIMFSQTDHLFAKEGHKVPKK